MKKTKQEYDAPDISVTQVEVETALCGSADIANPNSPTNGQIESQVYNNAFDSGLNANDYSTNSTSSLVGGVAGTSVNGWWTPDKN